MFAMRRGAVLAVVLSTVVAGGTFMTSAPAPVQAAGPPTALLPTDNPANWTPNVLNGQVNSIWQFGSKVVIGGTFTQVANADSNGGAVYDQAYLAAFDATTGVIDPDFDPELGDAVEVIIPGTDANTFFVGGDFNTIDGANRRKVAKLNVSDGSLTSFNIGGSNARVRDLRLVGNTLYVAGLFTSIGSQPRRFLASVNATTAAVTTAVDFDFAGLYNGGAGKVIKIDVNQAGTRMLITGNFMEIDGQPREQVALIDLSTTPATLSPWRTQFFDPATPCAGAFDSFTRDLDISPDGTYAVISTTGAYRPPPTSCDTISRFELTSEVDGLSPTWINYTGGDTSYAVEIHDGVAYIGGHMRWFNNPFGSDRHAAGGVSRPGMGALDVVSGLPFTWNPTRTRGVGLFDYHVTPQGIWAGSDTDRFNNELRMKLAFFPWTGGTTVLGSEIGELPADIYALGRTSGTTGTDDPTVLHRINAGGPELAAADDGPPWLADTAGTSPYRNSGSSTSTAPTNQPPAAGAAPRATPQNDSTVLRGDLDRPPAHLWTTERWDPSAAPNMQWAFPVPAGIPITVRLYFANRFNGTDNTGDRVFDVLLDGDLVLDDLDLSRMPGHDIGTMRSFDIVSDGTVDIEFVHGEDNPLINGIEIIRRDLPPTNNLGQQDEVRKLTWTGAGVPTVEPVANTTVPWQTVRGAFQVNASLFTFHADGSLMRRSFNASGFGAGTVVDGWANTMMADIPNLGGVFYDPASSSIFYTVAGNTNLYRRGFLPESGVLHAVRSTVTTGNVAGLAPARVRGMFLSGGRLYFADATTGDLSSIAWSNGAPTGAVQLEEGTADWRARALFLAVGSTPNVAPSAVIAPPTCVDNACDFDGTGSTDPDGTIVSFDWDFGDGGLPRTGASTSYSYGAAGTYTVTLTVTDDDGDVDTAQRDVTVGDPPNEPPTAVATASCSGATCSFSGAGSSDPDGTIAGYLWDFGDGATATGVTATHTFTASGTYTVELIVTDDDGDEGDTSVDVTVTVTGPPTGPIPIVPLDPARLLETRTGPNDTTIDGQAQGIGRRPAGSITELTVTNRAGVPANATAVMINLTAVLPDGNGFLTAFPCGTDQPNASSVNYAPGQVVPNAVLAKIGTNGRICIFTLAATDILVDVTGYT